MKTGTHTQVPMTSFISVGYRVKSKRGLAGLPLHNYAEAV